MLELARVRLLFQLVLITMSGSCRPYSTCSILIFRNPVLKGSLFIIQAQTIGIIIDGDHVFPGNVLAMNARTVVSGSRFLSDGKFCTFVVERDFARLNAT